MTGHPLDHYMVILRACTSSTTATAAAETKERAITIGGVVSALRSLTTKKAGKLMAHVTLEDVLGTIKVVVSGRFPELVLPKDLILYLVGRLTAEGANFKVIEFQGPAIETMPTYLSLANG